MTKEQLAEFRRARLNPGYEDYETRFADVPQYVGVLEFYVVEHKPTGAFRVFAGEHDMTDFLSVDAVKKLRIASGGEAKPVPKVAPTYKDYEEYVSYLQDSEEHKRYMLSSEKCFEEWAQDQ